MVFGLFTAISLGRSLYNSTRPSRPVIINGTPEPSRPINVGAAKGLGITQIVTALLCITVGVLMETLLHNQHGVGIGFIVGGGILICGILTVCVGYNPQNSCLVSAARVFNILASIGSAVMGIIFYVDLQHYMNCGDNYYSDSNYESDLECFEDKSKAEALNGSLMGFMVVEFFVALFASIYGGPGCCHANYANAVVINQQPQCQVVTSHTTTTMQHPGMQQNVPYAMPNSQYSQYYTSTNAPTYSTNSTNAPYSFQSTHDQAQLIDISSERFEQQPPVYRP